VLKTAAILTNQVTAKVSTCNSFYGTSVTRIDRALVMLDGAVYAIKQTQEEAKNNT
jgi:hypothetical protein